MKTLHYLIILVSFTAFTGCDKEETKKSTEPAGWFLSGSIPREFKIGVDNQNTKQGLKSGFIESTTDTLNGFGTMMQNCSEKDFKGKRVKMTGYIQLLGSAYTYALMWVRVDDFEKRVAADFDNMADRPIVGTHYWTKCEIVFDVPESPCVVNYGIVLDGVGKAWFDSVSFDTVSYSTFKTAYYLNEPFIDEYQIWQDLPESPVNLDFEE